MRTFFFFPASSCSEVKQFHIFTVSVLLCFCFAVSCKWLIGEWKGVKEYLSQIHLILKLHGKLQANISLHSLRTQLSAPSLLNLSLSSSHNTRITIRLLLIHMHGEGERERGREEGREGEKRQRHRDKY